MKIALLEQENKTIKKAVASCPGILFLNASDMPSACEMLSGGKGRRTAGFTGSRKPNIRPNCR